MAEMSLDLEDGERYLPSGILLGEDGWTGRRERCHGHEIPRLQSFFSDGVAGLPCYPSDFFSPLPPRLPSPLTKTIFSQSSNSASPLPHLQQGVGCVYRRDCVHRYRSAGEGMRMADNRGRFYPSMGGKMHGGTGVFLPLPRLRGEWGKGQTTGAREERKWVLPKRENKSAMMATTKQGKPRPEMALPHDWTY